MKIKYIDPDTNYTVIQSFSTMIMEKVDNEYELSFLCDLCTTPIVNVYVSSFSLANEYMNTIYEQDKIDFSNDANVRITTEVMDPADMQSFLDSFGIDDDEDLNDIDPGSVYL